MLKSVAVLTSGGDAPGMNAAIRAVVRLGTDRGLAVHGVSRGFRGLIEGDIRLMGPRDVGGILQLGGTLLGSSRCPEARTEAGRRQALSQLSARGIDGLVVIGGNGSQTGAEAFSRLGLPVVGVASTIDNDLLGTDVTIGASTAVDVALESVDRLRVTGSSHHRGFFVEVMGRDCGWLATMVGLAGGAEAIVIPEQPTAPEALADEIRAAHGRGKRHAIVVVAEGVPGGADALAAHFAQHESHLGFEMRVCRLGHVQRGGAPLMHDRLLATRLGAAAIEALAAGRHGVLVGEIGGRSVETPLAEVAGRTKAMDPSLLALGARLER